MGYKSHDKKALVDVGFSYIENCIQYMHFSIVAKTKGVVQYYCTQSRKMTASFFSIRYGFRFTETKKGLLIVAHTLGV